MNDYERGFYEGMKSITKAMHIRVWTFFLTGFLGMAAGVAVWAWIQPAEVYAAPMEVSLVRDWSITINGGVPDKNNVSLVCSVKKKGKK